MTVKKLPAFEGSTGIRDVDFVARLNRAGIGQQFLFCEQQSVAHSEFCPFLAGKQAAHISDIDYGVLGSALRLAFEQIGDCRDGVNLKLLVGVELKLQVVPALNGSEAPRVAFCFPPVRGFKDVRRVRLELVIPGEAFVQADDSFWIALGHRPNQFQGQLALQADE